MGLIKSNTPAATKPVTFSMADIEAQARQIVLRARQQADQLLAAAQTEGGMLRQQMSTQGHVEGKATGMQAGREEGRKLGEAAALEENRAKLAQVIATLTNTSAMLESSRKKLITEAQCEVVQLAINIARKVSKSLGEIDPSVLRLNIADAMKFVVSQVDVRIGVNPGQKALFFELLPKLKTVWPNMEHVEIVEDPTVAAGGCRIFTRGGNVDATLDAQIDRIASELLGSSKTQ